MRANTIQKMIRGHALLSLRKYGTRICGTFELDIVLVRRAYARSARFDELHPSEQANRVVARHILDALSGKGPFVSWYGAK